MIRRAQNGRVTASPISCDPSPGTVRQHLRGGDRGSHERLTWSGRARHLGVDGASAPSRSFTVAAILLRPFPVVPRATGATSAPNWRRQALLSPARVA